MRWILAASALVTLTVLVPIWTIERDIARIRQETIAIREATEKSASNTAVLVDQITRVNVSLSQLIGLTAPP